MTVSKLNPWNWFKKESAHERTLPVKHTEREAHRPASPLDQFHAEFDRMMDTMFSGFGITPPRRMLGHPGSRLGDTAIKPQMDVYGTDREYVIEADLPGVEEDDLSLELQGDTLVLTAKKEQEKKTEGTGYYRVERSYGSFRRVLDLPEDADRENIEAKLTKGVLRITLPRTQNVRPGSRQIAIESTANV